MRSETPGMQKSLGEQLEAASSMPESFCCGILYDPLEDPVITKYGYVYNRKAIEEAVKNKPLCPYTTQPLSLTDLESKGEEKGDDLFANLQLEVKSLIKEMNSDRAALKQMHVSNQKDVEKAIAEYKEKEKKQVERIEQYKIKARLIPFYEVLNYPRGELRNIGRGRFEGVQNPILTREVKEFEEKFKEADRKWREKLSEMKEYKQDVLNAFKRDVGKFVQDKTNEIKLIRLKDELISTYKNTFRGEESKEDNLLLESITSMKVGDEKNIRRRIVRNLPNKRK